MNSLLSLVLGARPMRHFLAGVLLVLSSLAARAQQPDTAAARRNIRLQNVDVAPSALDTKGWLLLNPDIRLELEGAVHNLYNSKFDKAERQFRSLRRRYPQHPMPYFLLGLSTWWKIVPTNVTARQHDKAFFAYMDSTVSRAETLYDADEKNYEACFFLSAAYGFSARLHAERRDWARATIEAKRALKYLGRSQEANGLSPEFLFGQALFNYYAVWIGEEYSWLKPVLLLFPKGNRELGLQQLRHVANNGIYTGPEARFFLLKILSSEREKQDAEALTVARKLATDYPDNAYFQRLYARQCFSEGDFRECERVSLDILDKYNRGFTGYDGFSGRYAAYYLGFIHQHNDRSPAQAKAYYQRCLVFSEATNQTTGYYEYALLKLARIAVQENDAPAAGRYYKNLLKLADHKSEAYREAKDFLQSTKQRSSKTDRHGARPVVGR